MSEKVNLFNKKTARRRLLPFGLGALAAGIISGATILGNTWYHSNQIGKGEERVVALIEQQDYDSAKRVVESLYEDETFNEGHRRVMFSAIDVSDEVSKLEEKIADFDYNSARRIFNEIKDDIGTSKLKNMHTLKENIKRINPENILERAQEYLDKGFQNDYRNTSAIEEKHKELRKDLFGLCLHDRSNIPYQATLVNVLLDTNGVYSLNDEELLRQRLSEIADFSKEFSDVEIPITSYETLVDIVLNTAKPRSSFSGTNYTQTTLHGDLLSLNAIVNIPDNLRERVKRRVFESYETAARQAIQEHFSSINVIDVSSIVNGLFRDSQKYSHTILNHTIYHGYLSQDLRPLTKEELKEQQRLEREKLKYTTNLEIAQRYLKEITGTLIPKRKYGEAYQRVLEGRKALMNDGIQKGEETLLSEYERLGMEITNLIRK